MGRLLIVSNRLPVTVHKRRGHLHFEPSAGGLATGLSSLYKSYNALWIGWPGIDRKNSSADRDEIREKLLAQNCLPVFLSQREVDEYYNKFCSATIWPLFHYFPQYASYSESAWKAYEHANQTFCDAIVEVWQQGDIIWVQDFQLMLLPRMLRSRLQDPTIGFFLHIPFPSIEMFRMLPWRTEILEGIMASDLVGFHTWDYAGHFLASVRFLLGHESWMGRIPVGDRSTRVDVFPMGIDYSRFASAANSPEVEKEVDKLNESFRERRTILSVDRLDYTKGILQRLDAFDLFLDRNPQYREKLKFVLVVVPSRTMVARYALLKKQIDELVGAINGKHGSLRWTPITYTYRSVPFESLVALYRRADVALVTPLRDGMNLVAKEYLASRTDGRGVLILSETAGAAKELGEAVTVNVNNEEDLVASLETAFAMTDAEQGERLRVMQRRLRRYDVRRWAEDFLNTLQETASAQEELRTRVLGAQARRKLVKDYQQAQRRLLLLDYDGTLVPFFSRPSKAVPTQEVLELLSTLSNSENTDVVLISGRERTSLNGWFGELHIGMVAEHGVWLKPKGADDWEMFESLNAEWKEEVRPIFELYADRTPGSFVEEKDFSLAFQYRRSDSRLGDLRARELVLHLEALTTNLNLQVLEGSKVVEVKNSGVNKGRAAQRWFSEGNYDFILAIGDDWTDEDTFRALPDGAWSIKVGFGTTAAHYNLGSPGKVTTLLRDLLTVED
ncbi:MAG: bifunctional alpha,alpha-trehalose-phosphate synthase (UDP-forming)/trehalose-phosphatase [Dehalococcoidia bacterium]|nr:bifunctional alpha,alpha-trehalose-phosphate synthase (UDP-forming)/trehalose-phosphatase [Dehalococcoidia bacterium]